MSPTLTADRRSRSTRERGNTVVLSFLLVTFLAALSTAFFAKVQKSSRQSTFFNNLGELRRYAESGIHLALHELTYRVGNADGNIGTETWTVASDFGRDGKLGTRDEGELDGIPTPGEPNLRPAAVGPGALGSGILVRTSDTGWADIIRIVSTASNPEAIATVEVYAQRAHYNIPGVGAIYVQPGVALDVDGNSFTVTGNDTNPNRTKGSGSTVSGISTGVGSPAGSNSSTLIDQVPAGRDDNITGTGGTPSITETDLLNFDQLWDMFNAAPKTTLAPGTYSKAVLGNDATNDYRVTYCKGALELSGSSSGAGVLIVDGTLTMSGQSTFVGVVIVRGDAIITGGGAGVHVYGSLLTGGSSSDSSPTLVIAGNSTLDYSSLALAKASALLPPYYTILYWNDIK